MDTYSVKCKSCEVEYKVKASSEREAIEKAKIEHEATNREATAFRCDLGPFMTDAFNLTRSSHPCVPREW
jgi:hypothetical protein